MEQLTASDFIIEGADDTQENVFASKPVTYGQDAWNRFRKNKVAAAAAVILLLLILTVIFGPLISGYSITESTNTAVRNNPPSITGISSCPRKAQANGAGIRMLSWNLTR